MKTEIKGYFEVTYNWSSFNGCSGTENVIIKAKDIFEANKKYLVWVEEKAKLGYYASTGDTGFWTHPLQCDID